MHKFKQRYCLSNEYYLSNQWKGNMIIKKLLKDI